MSTEQPIAERAKALGWTPTEEFKGDPEKWIDAPEFVARGEEIMPILRSNNRRLERELSETQKKLAEQATALEASQAAIKELKEFNTAVSKERMEQVRKELLAELRQAKVDGDVDRELELTDQLATHKAATAAAPKVEEPKSKPTGPDPELVRRSKEEFDAWKARNSWYDTDDVKTAVAVHIAQKLRASGSELVGTAFYDEVAKQVEAKLGGPPPADKVEGGGRSSGGGGSASRGKTFGDLPADARATAERMLSKGTITVGKGKFFETAEAFRQHYATKFFEE